MRSDVGQFEPGEFVSEVKIPRVGAMLRIERRDPEGNVFEVEYRRAATGAVPTAATDARPAFLG